MEMNHKNDNGWRALYPGKAAQNIKPDCVQHFTGHQSALETENCYANNEVQNSLKILSPVTRSSKAVENYPIFILMRIKDS